MKNEINNTYHHQKIEELYQQFNTSKNGLVNDQNIINNRQLYGANKLINKKPKKWYHFFFAQYKDLLMITLLIASVVSLLVSIIPQENYGVGGMLKTFEGWENFVLIVLVTIVNAFLGMVQSLKAQKSLEGLKKLSAPKAKVMRNQQVIVIDSEDIVVGDVVLIEAGDIIPADGRIIDSFSLKVNESSLTGESMMVDKNNLIIEDKNIGIGDKLNSVFSGCLVVYGRAQFLVTAVGKNTEIGKINTLLNETKNKKTPLQNNLDKLAKFLVIVILIVCLILFIINIIKIPINHAQGQWVSIFGDSINFSVALAVAVIPEALSSIVTIVLALSTKSLSKQHAIVKELKAVEGLGSVSIICSDKTGTLTQNKMTVTNLYTNNELINANDSINDQQLFLAELGVLCSDAKIQNNESMGDPTEVCLVEYYNRHFNSEILREKYPRIAELPFDSERMMMSTLIKYKTNENLMITKGAIDKLLNKIEYIYIDQKIRKINANDLHLINQRNKMLASEGERVLCFAFKYKKDNKLDFNDEKGLVFVGLISMIDPPRNETIQAIKECKIAGIKPIMITGDHLETAVAIAKQIGIFNENTDLALNGKQLKAMNEDELANNVTKYSVYARVSPEDKIKIVRAWQKQNMIVSMTGDGVNDAPALKEANIGIAMGITGTEVSKEASSMILTDDNFATIVTAIKSGRNVYNNIKSAIRFLLTGSLSTIIATTVFIIFSLCINVNYVPFAAIQLLFLNLLTDSWPAIALGLEAYRKNVIYEKPRKADEFFINKKFLLKILLDSLLMSGIVILSFVFTYYSLGHGEYNIGTNLTYNEILYDQAAGIAFLTLAFSRLFHAFNCRYNHAILFNKELFSNKWVIASLIWGTCLIAFIYYTPAVNDLFMHVSISMKKNEIVPLYKNYAIWVAMLYGLLVFLFYQIIQKIVDLIKNYHNSIKPIKKIISKLKNVNRNEANILFLLQKEEKLTLSELKIALNQKKYLLSYIFQLQEKAYLQAKTENNAIFYYLNPKLTSFLNN